MPRAPSRRRVASRNPWEIPLLDWAEQKARPIGVPEALLHLGVTTEKHIQKDANRVAGIFKAAGWKRWQRREGEDRVWLYRPLSPVSPDDPDPCHQCHQMTPALPVTEKLLICGCHHCHHCHQ